MRLRRSDPGGPGWRRRARGRGFSYESADGSVPDAAELARIKSLAIPPAWRDVWICPHANGHLQAVGTDSAGRRQYLYHERWRRERDEEKYERVVTLAPLLPEFRAEVGRALRGRGREHDRVVAVALAMLDHGVFRVGGESSAEDNGTHGVTTLLCSHVGVRGSAMDFCYPAKGGIEFCTRVVDEDLARAVKVLRRGRSGDDRLLVDRAGGEVTAEEANERFKDLVGQEYSVKDLRTWHAMVLAAVALARAERPSSQRGRKRVEAAVMREVSEHLGNTPAVARKSYVDPRLVELYGKGVVLADVDGDRETVEKAVVELLST
ncbi:DNA topoisomerase IB [Actinosynnema sp. NPDC047251]|uniref:DNA topoisomerase n=1 Tax=Saccharothrix espanaensis (strain ATCC 51144 / DSM 44229 / JCM 9112 / NBRC 15066 / NRRL 15764) TaxID=1179773 RepID=K0K652_SACES|nr:DNA topoisomerase IB [Saccharothrix espanaensis]CCH32028.1 putative DNA topoisomerase [Saccharothrix espanaensis DSM 44229]